MEKKFFRSSEVYKQNKQKASKGAFFKRLRRNVNLQLVGWLSKNALQENNNLVLEAGSGTAEGASLFASRLDVRLSIALDLNPESLRIARERDKKICLVQGDLFRMPFKPGVFDLVWNNSTIEHIHESRRVIYEMVRATKPGGRVFLGAANENGPLFFQSWIASTQLGKSIGHLFNQETLSIDIEGTGLTLEKFTTFFYKTFLGCLAKKE
jgi:ubiquinone/menaquinone biosynthesis C-methylase UbiE